MSESRIQKVGHMTITTPLWKPLTFSFVKIAFCALPAKFYDFGLAVCQVNDAYKMSRVNHFSLIDNLALHIRSIT